MDRPTFTPAQVIIPLQSNGSPIYRLVVIMLSSMRLVSCSPGLGEGLKEHVDVRVDGLDKVLVHPHGEVPEHGPELDGEDRHAADHHHGQGVAGQDDDQGEQGVDAEQQQRLDHGQGLAAPRSW